MRIGGKIKKQGKGEERETQREEKETRKGA